MPNLFDATIPVLTKYLHNLEKWLDKAVAYADHKKFDPERYLTSRLAIDQYDLTRQIQSACDTAKYAAAKLTGQTAPSHPDTEKTIAEVRARIATVVTYLGTFKPEDFNGAEERAVTYPFFGGKSIRGNDYLDLMVLPNFYFHVTTAYAILRNNGVDIGKGDFLGDLPLK
jgi:hypothetical protein